MRGWHGEEPCLSFPSECSSLCNPKGASSHLQGDPKAGAGWGNALGLGAAVGMQGGGALAPPLCCVCPPAVDEQNKQTQAYQATVVPSKKDSSEELNKEEERLCKAPIWHAASFKGGFEGSSGVGSLSSHLQPTLQALGGRR